MQNSLSSKDLSFLSDMFNWNLNCYNAFNLFENEMDNNDAKVLLDEIKEMHKSSCEDILNLMK